MSDAVSQESLKFTVIIPEWPENTRPFGMDYIEKLDWPHGSLEIIVARGYSPCKQRNEAAGKATGEILVFYDNDSCPKPNSLELLAEHFTDPKVSGVGGPNPAWPTIKFTPQLVDAVLTSPLAVFSKARRYKPVGQRREGGDSDFIFCNFAMRKEDYLQLGGLDERLCPNEENEFFERFSQNMSAKKLLYDPQLIATEPRPDTIQGFLIKIYGYGRGRATQFRIRPSLWSLIHILLALSAFILPILVWVWWQITGVLILLGLYLVLLLIQFFVAVLKEKPLGITLSMIPLTTATHFAYLSGLLIGLLFSLKRSIDSSQGVDLEIVHP